MFFDLSLMFLGRQGSELGIYLAVSVSPSVLPGGHRGRAQGWKTGFQSGIMWYNPQRVGSKNVFQVHSQEADVVSDSAPEWERGNQVVVDNVGVPAPTVPAVQLGHLMASLSILGH